MNKRIVDEMMASTGLRQVMGDNLIEETILKAVVLFYDNHSLQTCSNFESISPSCFEFFCGDSFCYFGGALFQHPKNA